MDITVSGLEKSFGENKVLRGFSACFEQGKLSCIMGRSGCGKTTLLNILLGLETSDGGEILGVPDRVSCVFQEDRLCEAFSAVTNVRIACDKRTARGDIERELAEVGLDGSSFSRPVRELSGGMKRRAALVRALMADSELVVLDEPFKGLDGATKLRTAQYVKRKLHGRTAIMVTHDEEEIALLDGRLIVMPDPV